MVVREGVDVGAAAQQHLDGRLVAMHGSKAQRRPAVGVAHVGVAAEHQQRGQGRGVVAAGGEVQGVQPHLQQPRA